MKDDGSCEMQCSSHIMLWMYLFSWFLRLKKEPISPTNVCMTSKLSKYYFIRRRVNRRWKLFSHTGVAWINKNEFINIIIVIVTIITRLEYKIWPLFNGCVERDRDNIVNSFFFSFWTRKRNNTSRVRR